MRTLAAGEFWCPLFVERVQTFPDVVAVDIAFKSIGFRAQSGIDRLLETVVDQFLNPAQTQGAVFGNFSKQFIDLGHELVVGDHFIYQAVLFQYFRGQQVAGEQKPFCERVWDFARQALRLGC